MSCPASGLLDVRDRVAAALARLADPAAAVTVETAFAPDWLDPDLWKDNPGLAARFTGRRVFVFAAGKAQAATASRKLDLNEYRVEVVVIERYAAAGPPPDDWVAERVAWVETEIYDRLGDARAVPLPVRDCFPQSQEWDQVYSYELLRELKLFRSGVIFGFRRLDF